MTLLRTKTKEPCDAALTRAWLHCCSSCVNCWKTASPSILPSVWLASSANNNNKSIQTNVRVKCVTDEIGDGVQCPYAHAHRLMTCQRHETGFGVRFDQRGATDGVCWQTNDEWERARRGDWRTIGERTHGVEGVYHHTHFCVCQQRC